MVNCTWTFGTIVFGVKEYSKSDCSKGFSECVFAECTVHTLLQILVTFLAVELALREFFSNLAICSCRETEEKLAIDQVSSSFLNARLFCKARLI